MPQASRRSDDEVVADDRGFLDSDEIDIVQPVAQDEIAVAKAVIDAFRKYLGFRAVSVAGDIDTIALYIEFEDDVVGI
jgi:hypothetical protein